MPVEERDFKFAVEEVEAAGSGTELSDALRLLARWALQAHRDTRPESDGAPNLRETRDLHPSDISQLRDVSLDPPAHRGNMLPGNDL